MHLIDLLPEIGLECGKTEITGFTQDSRKVKPGMAFVAVSGTGFDGHSFAKAAVESGAVVVVCERDIGIKNQVVVEDTKAAFATMSANYFGNPASKLTLIGVTGTNGKTSITYMLKAILEKAGKKVGLIGTIKNMIGDTEVATSHTTPDSFELNSLFSKMSDAGCEYAVMEVSSHALEQKRVYNLDFEVAAFTNLTQDHLDYHITMDNYLAAKKKLFKMCHTAVINVDDSYAGELIKGLSCEVKGYSLKNSNYYATDITYKSDGVHYKLNGEANANISLKTGGNFSVYNSMCAAAVALNCGIDSSIVETALAELNGVKGRAEVVPNDLGFTVILDYAHTPDGIVNILSAFKSCNPKKLTVLFGCGGDRDKTKRPLMGKAAASLSDYMIITSDNPRSEEPAEIIKDILSGLKDTKTPYIIIENRIEAINFVVKNAQKGDIIVLAGKGHEDYQILKTGKIHLDEREVVADAIKARGGHVL